jgi:hypothetical protein
LALIRKQNSRTMSRKSRSTDGHCQCRELISPLGFHNPKQGARFAAAAIWRFFICYAPSLKNCPTLTSHHRSLLMAWASMVIS